MRVGTWRDLRETWTWAIELADDPALVDRPDRVLVLSLAADAARLMGDFAGVERYADGGLRHWPTRRPIPTYLARAYTARAAVLHFRGDFEGAADEWLRGAATGTTEAGALTPLGRARDDVRRRPRAGPFAARPGRGS